MNISKQTFDTYRRALQAIEAQAADAHAQVAYVLEAQLGLDEAAYKEALKNVTINITESYARASARVAARFSSAIYEADTGTAAAFDIAPIDVREAVTHGINWDADPDKVLAKTEIFLRSLVRRGARNTVIRSTHATGGRWARIPQGMRTCAFCMILASHGFYYRSEETAGGGMFSDRFHNDCDCLVVPSWSNKCTIEGYDPGVFKKMYKEAKKKAGTTDLNKVAAVMRSMYGVK